VITPAVTIRFTFEDRPRVLLEVENESESQRLEDWVMAHPAYARLIADACELADEARAA
jgi:hypothetical protein